MKTYPIREVFLYSWKIKLHRKIGFNILVVIKNIAFVLLG
jgi:hypothetical protein